MYPSMYICKKLTKEQCDMVEKNYRLVYSYVHSFLNTDNGSYLLRFYDFEDIVGVGNLAFCRAVQSFDCEKAELSTWTRAVIFSQLKDLLNYGINRVAPIASEELQRQQIMDKTACACEYNNPADVLDNAVEKSLIRKATKRAKLSGLEKKVINLVIGKGMRQVEVAKLTNKPEYTISRARTSALKKIEKEYLKIIS